MTIGKLKNNQKQRIAVVMHNYYPIAVRERREVESLIEAGYHVDVYCLKQMGQVKKELSEKLHIYRFAISKKRAGKIRYFFEYLSFFFCMLFVLPFKQISRKYCLYQIHNIPDFLVFSVLLPKLLFKIKIILDIRDPMPETFRFKFSLPEEHRWIRLSKWLEKISIQFSNHVLTVHDQLKNIHIQRGCKQNKITDIMNLPDHNLFPPKLQENAQQIKGEFRIVYIGSIGERHGIQTAIRSIPQLIKKIPTLHLKIIGEGEYLEDLIRMTNKLQVENFVSFHDFIPLDDVANELKQADVGICLQQGLFGDIAFPTKVGEYLKMGVPAIVSKTEITESYFSENMVAFISQGNVEEFTEKIEKLKHDKKYRLRLVEGGRKFSAERNWFSEKRKYIDLIQGILA